MTHLFSGRRTSDLSVQRRKFQTVTNQWHVENKSSTCMSFRTSTHQKNRGLMFAYIVKCFYQLRYNQCCRIFNSSPQRRRSPRFLPSLVCRQYLLVGWVTTTELKTPLVWVDQDFHYFLRPPYVCSLPSTRVTSSEKEGVERRRATTKGDHLRLTFGQQFNHTLYVKSLWINTVNVSTYIFPT